MLGKPDQFTRQELQGPARAACGWARAGRRNQQRFLLARELAVRSGAWFLAERRLQVAEHEPALGPIDCRAADADTGGDCLVAGAHIGRQQNLRSLELARGVLAATQKRCEFGSLGLAQFDPIAYIHPCLLV